MSEARKALAIAIAAHAAAANDLDAANAAVDHAADALADLQAKHDGLAAAAKSRSEGIAGRLIAAFRAGAAPDLAEAPGSLAERAARIEAEEMIATHGAVLTKLLAERDAASAEMAAAETLLDRAARKVACEEASMVAAEMEQACLEVTALHRRLQAFGYKAAPRAPQHRGGYPELPLEVATAVHRDFNALKAHPIALVVDQSATMATGKVTYLPGGSLGELWSAEEEAWEAHLAALKIDPEASFASPS